MFTVGQQVTWIRETWAGDIPIKAVVLGIGSKRIKIAVTLVRTGEQVIKHVSPASLR